MKRKGAQLIPLISQERGRRLEADVQRLQAEADAATRQRDSARADLSAAEVKKKAWSFFG